MFVDRADYASGDSRDMLSTALRVFESRPNECMETTRTKDSDLKGTNALRRRVSKPDSVFDSRTRETAHNKTQTKDSDKTTDLKGVELLIRMSQRPGCELD